MMRICPKCGAYYADTLLAFCLVDGAPLANVDPLSDSWTEGARVVEEKENALRKQKRKLKWRRVLMTAMMMLIATMVVFVVAANSFIYLRPKQEQVVLATPSTPATTPTQTTTLTATPTPTPVYKISGRVTDRSKALGGVNITLDGAKFASTKTDANGNYTFSGLLTGGSYIITPASVKIDFKPHSRSINNLTQDTSADFIGTAQPTPTPTPTPSPTPTPPKCSIADKSSEEKSIIDKYGAEWRRKIAGERNKIISENVPVRVANANGPAGFVNAEATLVSIEYESSFSKGCTASVMVRYVWQVKTKATLIVPGKDVTVRKVKRFACVKAGETWRCS